MIATTETKTFAMPLKISAISDGIRLLSFRTMNSHTKVTAKPIKLAVMTSILMDGRKCAAKTSTSGMSRRNAQKKGTDGSSISCPLPNSPSASARTASSFEAKIFLIIA